ncbi:MAG: hypothetical protein MJ191_00205 [Clostridium sp.]|nr:hypothetical protein [Clostridium sp.]
MEITLTITKTEDDKLQITSSAPANVLEVLTMTFTAQLHLMNAFIDAIKPTITEEELQTLKEDLYDKYNAGASNILYLYLPDHEMHPDLTVEAMKAAEDKYMSEVVNKNKKTKTQTPRQTSGDAI